MGASAATEVHAYIWATGQDDNIGDSLLRRPAIRDARLRANVLNVFHGESTPTFDAGLDLATSDVSHRKFRSWAFHAWRMGWRRRTLIIPNAGEVRVSRRGSVRMLSILLASLAPKTRVLWIGAGVPGRNSIWAQPYRLVARRAKLATFRDFASAELLGRGSVTPDWAFALGTNVENWTPAEGREKIALVLRGDRSRPSEDWLEWVRGLAKSHSLAPVVVAQVRRDNELAASLAEELNGQALLFEHDTPHSRQESLVREVYRQSSFVVGDRLHGLVVAATEGAIPIGWVESSSGKIKRHFDAIEMAYVGQFEGKDASILPDITEQDLDDWRLELRSRISQARAAIDSTLIAADEVAGRSPEAPLYDGTLTDG